MTSEIRANTLKNRVGLGTVSFTNTGIIVSGIVTANSFSGPLISTSIDLNGDLDVDGHTNLDNVSIAGVVTATSFVGNLTGTASGNPTLTNGADNRVITAASANTLNGEANLTWDGNKIHATATGEIARFQSTNSVSTIRLYSTASGFTEIGHTEDTYIAVGGGERFRISQDGNVIIAETMAVNRPRIVLSAPDRGSTAYSHLFGANLHLNSSGTFTTPTSNISGGGWEYLAANSLNAHGDLRYISAPDTNATSSTPVERLRIDSSGRVMIGTTTEGLATYGEDLTIGSSDHAGITLRTGTSHKGTIYFSDATSGTAEYIGSLQYDHSDNSMRLRVNGTDTLFINSSNNLKVPDSSELQFGGSLNSGNGDLRIRHDGNNSIISHNGGGDLLINTASGEKIYIDSSEVIIRNSASNETMIQATENSDVELYHNGSIRAYTAADGFALSRVNTFSNPNNTGSETLGAMLDIGGNTHLQEVHPVGAYTDRCDLVLNTNSGYGQGLSDKIRITAGGRVVIYSSVQRTYNKGWAPGNLVLQNNSNDNSVDFTQGILFTDNANNQSNGGWMHAAICTVGTTGYNGNICFGTDGNGVANNNTGGLTEKMRLTHDGKLLIGTTSSTSLGSHTGNANVSTFNQPGITLTAYSVVAGFYYDRLNFNNAQYFIVNNSGTGVYLGNGNTSWSAYSDERLKTNITELDGTKAYNHVKTARAASFKWNATGYPTDMKIGFIAQDWETNYPELVNTTTETIDSVENPKAIQYTETVPVLMAALKQAISKIETLEAEVAALKSS